MTKILLIGSELKNNKNFFKSLQTEGFDVIVAENAFIDRHQVQSELPDLIICYVIASELDCCGTIKTLRENANKAIIPLICVIDKPSITDIRKAMEIGADDCICYSCTEEELLKAIAIRLDRQAYILEWYAAQAKKVNLTIKNIDWCLTSPVVETQSAINLLHPI
ncbi:MAG: response regulator [Rivularia sp. (in: cyanobacteria)]|jgi:DNA-binding response OmpR family regulator